MTYIISSHNYSHQQQALVGGKAKNLFFLQGHGIQVPDFFCISAAAFYAILRTVKSDLEQIINRCDFNDLHAIDHASLQLKALVFAQEMPKDLLVEIQHHCARLKSWGAFSVRSSATHEDSLAHSFAGQFGTWLNVAPDHVEEKIMACWASAFDPGVLSYQHRAGINPLDTGVCVIVQGMVAARCSGVLFQADPQYGLSRLVIAAGYGLGEGIVGDKVESDIYFYHYQTRQWQAQISHKETRVDYAGQAGTRIVAVDQEHADKAVLNMDQRNALLRQSEQISKSYTHFQDIEWAFDVADQLYILQSRPITTIPKGDLRVFDNSNIAESYPDIILPMTYSIMSMDYRNSIKHGLMRLGLPRYLADRHPALFNNLVGYLYGRAYYNISNWYRLCLLAPFFRKRIIGSFNAMIGTSGSFSERLADVRISWCDRLVTGAIFPLRLFYILFRYEKVMDDYFRQAQVIKEQFEAIDLAAASSDELIGQLKAHTDKFMPLMGIPIINDFIAMIFMALTQEQLAKVGVPNAQQVLNALLYNQEIASAKPVRSMRALVDLVRPNEALLHQIKALLESAKPREPEAIQRTLADKGFATFAAALGQHLKAYGHRCPKELIMEQETYRENPLELLRVIAASAQTAPVDRVKGADPQVVLEKYVGRAQRKPLIRWLIDKTRQAVAHREATRLDRGLHFSHIRSAIRCIGQRLVAEGVVKAAQDIFYVTLEELDQYRKGSTPDCDLKALIAYRKKEVEKWRQIEPAEMISTSGSVFANHRDFFRSPAVVAKGDLRGTGCSDGVVTSEAVIVKNPNDAVDIRGKIIVSQTTDPGWVFIMSNSAGLVAERGSLLSHTAIIGRELGIPTIVGVKQATQLIKNGDILTINGKTGELSIKG